MTDLGAVQVVETGSLGLVIKSATEYAKRARSENTDRAYSYQLKQFRAWCDARGLSTDQPAGVALYLADRADAGASISTLAQALAAISQACQSVGLPSPRIDPTVRATWAGIRRTKGTAQRQASPLAVKELRRLSRSLPENLVGIRDRAILVLGFAAALRRSELVALTVENLEFTEDGLVVHVERSKSDQEAKGRKVGVPFGNSKWTCPVRSVQAWLQASGIESGPIFLGLRHKRLSGKPLTGGDVARILKRAAERVGLKTENLSGHSLRSGLVTAAAKAGKALHQIQRQSGHASIEMVAKYVRDADLFSDGNPAVGIGL